MRATKPILMGIFNGPSVNARLQADLMRIEFIGSVIGILPSFCHQISSIVVQLPSCLVPKGIGLEFQEQSVLVSSTILGSRRESCRRIAIVQSTFQDTMQVLHGHSDIPTTRSDFATMV